MKQINLFKTLLLAVLIGITGISNAQIHPLAFGSYSLGGTATNSNWYADYVGLVFQVTAPSVIAGAKNQTAAWSGTTPWGATVTTPIANVPVIMASDTSGCTTIPPGSMTGKIALVWRNHLATVGGCEFGTRSLNAQNAGATAVVIINDGPGEGPVGMAAGSVGGSVTVPVFMIGNLDGVAIVAQYNSLPANTVRMTITPWGQGNQRDLGFVSEGMARWHNYAIPSNQLGATGNPAPYNMLDGAFIANFGTHDITGVKVKSTTTFTPTGGSASTQHTDEVVLPGAFTVNDSIYAMFSSTEYSLNAPGTGRFDVNYTIESDSVDQFPADNSVTASFYVSDSVFSKGMYDFATQQPKRTLYRGGGAEFIWGNMYYVANAGTNLNTVQYSIAMNSTTAGYPYLPGANNVYMFKWEDGLIGGTPDSIVENGELTLVGLGVKNYDGFSDTSEVLLGVQMSNDLVSGDPTAGHPALEGSSWYYVAVDLPSTTAVPLFLGCDGVQDPYPRIYGRFHAGGLLDYSNMQIGGTIDSITAFPNQGNAVVPSTQVAFINSVDSFVYDNMKGLIPAVAMISSRLTNGVTAQVKPLAEVTLFPNPAKDQLNVSASFGQLESTVSYEIIDGLARFVSKETHTNVKNDTYTINTSKLASGNYYLIINAEGKAMAKKFVVAK